MADQRLRRVYGAGVFLILLVCYGYFIPKWGDWGANSRADMVFAVVEQGTFRIDAYHTNTNDKAYYQGHYYSDKSFGPSLIALPGYLTFRALARIDTLETRIMDEDSRLAQFFVSDITPNPGDRTNTAYEEMAIAAMAFWAAALPSALLGLLLYTFASGIMRQPLHAALLALTYGLATIAFPYSTVFYQHQLGALGMFGGFVALWKVIVEGARLRWLWGAGVMFGLAIIADYPTVPFLGMIGLWALVALWRDGRMGTMAHCRGRPALYHAVGVV